MRRFHGYSLAPLFLKLQARYAQLYARYRTRQLAAQKRHALVSQFLDRYFPETRPFLSPKHLFSQRLNDHLFRQQLVASGFLAQRSVASNPIVCYRNDMQPASSPMLRHSPNALALRAPPSRPLPASSGGSDYYYLTLAEPGSLADAQGMKEPNSHIHNRIKGIARRLIRIYQSAPSLYRNQS